MNHEMSSKLSIATVAIGSTNPVKIAAVRNSIQRIWPNAEVIGVAAESA